MATNKENNQMGKRIICLAFLFFTGCQTVMIDGQPEQALIIPVPNSYTDFWTVAKLVAEATGAVSGEQHVSPKE